MSRTVTKRLLPLSDRSISQLLQKIVFKHLSPVVKERVLSYSERKRV
ncbi:hypothetical protein [Stenomitos frigidus]|nr:hypothetical protein [Stenomitos frigidus]